MAAAGCGKTTFLSHVAARETAPVGWLTLDGALSSTAAVLAHLQVACADLAPAVAQTGPWRTTDDALAALERLLVAPSLLVLDELQSIDGSAAAGVVDELLLHQPVHLRIALGSRTATSTAMTRHLAGTATVLGAEDLRFRTWEVEELFRTCHGTRLRADEVADLAQRTGGWAAGLELFHLATRGRPPSSRARLLGVGGGQLSSDYLARHVLDQVPAPLRDFLVRTAVLATLTAARCDELLGSTDTAALLERAHRLGLLSAVADAQSTVYRCHEVMRAHLLDVLVGRDGGARARELHQRGAQLALREGDFDAALRSSCRAHDWDAAQRVLAVGGGELAERPGSWIDELPPSIRDTDPWVALALARRLVVDGALEEALEAYRLAGTRVETATGRSLAAHELRMVQSWLNPPLGVVSDWVTLTRDAFVSPRRQLAEPRPADAPRRLAHAVAQLTSGDLAAAAREFSAVSELPTLPSALEAVALLGEAVSLSLSFRPEAAESRERAAVGAKMLGAPALERIADGLDLACRPESAREALSHLRDRCAAIGDRWGAALLGLFGAVAGLPAGMLTADEHAALAAELTALGAPALATWCSTMAAVEDARAGRTRPGGTADVERAAAGVGPLPHTLALLAAGTGQGRVRATRLARTCGATTWTSLVLRGLRSTPRTPPPRRRHRSRSGASAGSRCCATACRSRSTRCALSTRRSCGRSPCTRRCPCTASGSWSGSGRGATPIVRSTASRSPSARCAGCSTRRRPHRRPPWCGGPAAATRCSSTRTTGTTCGASNGSWPRAGRRSSAGTSTPPDATSPRASGSSRRTCCPTTDPPSGSPACATRCARRWSARAGRWPTCAPRRATGGRRSRSRVTLSRSTGTRTASGCT